MNFSTFKYEKTNDYGIAIQTNILIGDLKELSKYQWIRYVKSVKLENDKNEYHGIAFYNLDEEYVEVIRHLFEKEWRKDYSLTIANIMQSFSNVFKKIKHKSNVKKYLGLMGEMLLIKKSELLGQDIKDHYSYGEVDNFDFHFPNGANIEAKYGNKESRSFLINWKQLSGLIKNNNYQLTVVLTELDSINGLDLFDLFHSIKDNNHKNLVVALEKITELRDTQEELFSEFKVVVEKSEFLFIDKSFLPKIEMKENNCLISGKFKLFINEEMGINFENKLLELVNEK